MNVGRATHAVAAAEGYLYALGGGDLSVLSSVEFAPVTGAGTVGAWLFTAPLLTPRFTFGAVGVGNKLYAVGGWSTLGCCDVDTVHHRSVEIGSVNPDGSVAGWAYGPDLVEGMGVGGIATNGEHIYYVGGFGESLHRSDRVQVTDILPDGSLTAWRTTTPLTFGREGPAVVVAANRLYAFGGYLEGPIVDTAQSAPILANGDLGPWRDEASMTVTRYAATAFAGPSKIFVGGGTFGVGGCTDQHASFEEAEIGADGILGPWMPSTSMTSGRNGQGGAMSGTTAVIVGGFSCGAARVDCEASVCLECASPIPAVSPHAAVLLGTLLIVPMVWGFQRRLGESSRAIPHRRSPPPH
jgi:hypothetical protein